METRIITDIIKSKNKIYADFPGDGNLNDILNYGFSFVETQDNLVSYLIAHPIRVKEIFVKIPESVLDPQEELIGKLWTADLITSKKVKEYNLIFANRDLTVILFLNTYPYRECSQRCMHIESSGEYATI